MTTIRIGPAALFDVNGEVFSEDDIDTPEDIEVYERALERGARHPDHHPPRPPGEAYAQVQPEEDVHDEVVANTDASIPADRTGGCEPPVSPLNHQTPEGGAT